jgi:hypothetical protein
LGGLRETSAGEKENNAMVEVKQELKIGQRRPDGSVYAGASPDTGSAMYAAPKDAHLICTFNEVADYTQQLNAQRFLGHNDWRVSTKDELNVLYNNHAEIGGFDISGSYSAGW